MSEYKIQVNLRGHWQNAGEADDLIAAIQVTERPEYVKRPARITRIVWDR